jgi:hypothetical protein
MYRHVSTALLVAGFSAACKEQKAPPPAATAIPTAYVAPITTNPQYQQVQPTVAPPLCDANLKECAPDPKVVELCRQQETDQTKCENGIEKALYESLMATLGGSTVGGAPTTETCKTTRYVNTQETGLIVRAEANRAASDIGEVARFASLCVIGQTSASDGIWYKLNYNNQVGYVFGELTSSSKPSGGSTTTNTPTSTNTAPKPTTTAPAASAECTLACPSGFQCSLTQNWGVHSPDYFRAAREEGSERVGGLQGGASLCASGNVQNVQFFGVVYTMVRVKVREGNSSGLSQDYWMNCKYLSAASKSRIGCQ